MSFEKIVVDQRGEVGIIRLNDPATLNALSLRMIDELNQALDRFAGSVRAIVLTGAGRGFCSGANLTGGLGGPAVPGEESDFGLVLETHVNPLMGRLRELTVPWIAAVRGAAAGVGCSLALAADLVVASETAYFLQAFSRIGLVPDGGSSHLLIRTIGRVRAMEMMLLAERVPARQAMEWGLVNRVVPDDALEGSALELAGRLAAGPTRTLGLIRQLAWTAVDTDWPGALRTERELQRIAGRTHDAGEGIEAFVQKRAPRFTGR
jgi:2-(1,2-epoxy-1,2-dihydrophenyl)acetyl-CoA isomerase